MLLIIFKIYLVFSFGCCFDPKLHQWVSAITAFICLSILYNFRISAVQSLLYSLQYTSLQSVLYNLQYSSLQSVSTICSTLPCSLYSTICSTLRQPIPDGSKSSFLEKNEELGEIIKFDFLTLKKRWRFLGVKNYRSPTYRNRQVQQQGVFSWRNFYFISLRN